MGSIKDRMKAIIEKYKVDEINTECLLGIEEGSILSANDVMRLFKYICAFNTNEYYVGITGRVRDREKEHNAEFLAVIGCPSLDDANYLEEYAKKKGFFTGGATGNGHDEDTTKVYIYKMIAGVTKP